MTKTEVNPYKNELTGDEICHTISSVDLYQQVKEAVQYCYQMKGQIPNSNDLEFIVKRLTHRVMEKYPTLRVKELITAFDSYFIDPKNADKHVISAVVLIQILDEWVPSEKRKNILNNVKESQYSSGKSEPTEAQKYAIAIEAYRESYKYYKKHGEILDCGNAIFDWIDRTSPVKLASGLRKKFYTEAVQEETARLTRERSSAAMRLNKAEVSSIDKELGQLIEGHNGVIAVAKRKALKHYFDHTTGLF